MPVQHLFPTYNLHLRILIDNTYTPYTQIYTFSRLHGQVTEGVVANAMHRNAFTHALKTVCGFENASIDEVPHHGMTDPLILLKMQVTQPPSLCLSLALSLTRSLSRTNTHTHTHTHTHRHTPYAHLHTPFRHTTHTSTKSLALIKDHCPSIFHVISNHVPIHFT